MSTAGQPHLEPAWKQEVNRRIAAHKNRKSGAAVPDSAGAPAHAANSRAAEAAARVAARYSKAPSYSQMQAEEARMAVRAAEIATKVALEAQAAAESALAELHAAAEEKPLRGPAVVESITREPLVSLPEPVADASAPAALETHAPVAETAVAFSEPEPVAVVEAPQPEPVVTHEVVDGRTFDLRWEPDLPLRTIELKPAAPRPQEDFTLLPEDWWTPAEVSEKLRSEPLHIEAQPTHANLIEFPRELVATRKMRPRLIEAAATAAADPQLSIFEVDPGAISTEPAPAASESMATADTWVGPEWSSIKLDAQPQTTVEVQPAPSAPRPDLAPLSRRLLATVVDGSLIAGAFFAVAMWGASHLEHVPAVKAAEAMAIAGLVLAGLAYHAVFFGMGTATPGMKYAGIAFSTFDDELPTRQQLHRRFGAMVLSLLPVGLGFAWSLFDDDHLTWHDRISGTYPRKR